MTRRGALLLATMLLIGASAARRASAFWRPAVAPLTCSPVVSAVSTDGDRLACLSDPAVAGCSSIAAGRRYQDCRDHGPVPGPLLRLHDMPIDLAQATVDDLRALPGFGPGLATKVLNAREGTLLCGSADLLRVSGVGSRRAKALEGLVFSTDARCPATNGVAGVPEAR